MSKHPLIVACCLLTTLGACAGAPPAPRVASAPLTPVSYDGNYQGHAQLVSASGVCPPSSYGVIQIADNTLNFAYLPTIIFVAGVAPDGALHQAQGPVVLDGRITGGRLAMTIRTPQCETRYGARIVWNHGA